MKVFITGATGFIGLAVGQAFARAGYEVYGLCRSEAKARLLAREEIRPVPGDLSRPETWAEAAAQATVVIHCAADLQAGMVGPDRAAVEALIAAGPRGPRPKTLIYTSGVWVNGSTGEVAADETTPLNPLPIVAWRPAHEQAVLSATNVRGIVLRPGCVYGRSGSLTASWFEGAHKKDLSAVGDGKNRWAMVHVDDLADACVFLMRHFDGAAHINVGTGEDLTIRFACFANSRKVAQLNNNPEVHLTCGVTGPQDMRPYLQIQGRAQFVTDRAERHGFWSDLFKNYFQGPDDPNYGVVVVKPYRIELWSPGSFTPEVWEA
jgi:nucleoside-diphosphate-sugar epimerase